MDTYQTQVLGDAQSPVSNIWSCQSNSLGLIAAILQVDWAVTLCHTDPLPPSGQLEQQIAGSRGATPVYVGLDVLWGVADSKANSGGNISSVCHGPHNTKQHGGGLNWPHHSPSLCHFLSPFPICISVYHQPFLPPLHLLKIIMLQCMGCLHPPCRIEAVSAKTTMWETANSSYSNTQLGFMRSSATLWCFDFSLHGVLAANTDTIDVPASPWANII